jgi:hypothetical protein
VCVVFLSLLIQSEQESEQNNSNHKKRETKKQQQRQLVESFLTLLHDVVGLVFDGLVRSPVWIF